MRPCHPKRYIALPSLGIQKLSCVPEKVDIFNWKVGNKQITRNAERGLELCAPYQIFKQGRMH